MPARVFARRCSPCGLAAYGSIHYRSDIEVGKDHGKRIAGYTIRFARQDGAD